MIVMDDPIHVSTGGKWQGKICNYYGNTIFCGFHLLPLNAITNDSRFRSAYKCIVKHLDSCILFHQWKNMIAGVAL